jgi:hypothetical protein
MNKEYYVSRTSLVVVVVFIAGWIALWVWGKNGVAILLPLVLVIVPFLTSYRRLLQLYLAKKPALVLTPEAFINNVTRKTYPWRDIKEIRMHASMPGRAAASYMFITFSDGREARLPTGSLVATMDDIYSEMTNYHKRYAHA